MPTFSTDDARELAIQLAPELSGKLEIVRQQPDWPAPPRHCDAYAHRLHFPAIDYLVAQGRCTAADPPSVIVVCTELTPELLIHEAAHLLPVRRSLLPDDLTPEDMAELRERQPALLSRVASEIDEHNWLPWEYDHGADWIRRCIHLWARAEALRIRIRQFCIRACWWTEHDINEYRRWLDWEPVQFAQESFSTIEVIPAPEYFVELFERDRAAWLHRHQQEQPT